MAEFMTNAVATTSFEEDLRAVQEYIEHRHAQDRAKIGVVALMMVSAILFVSSLVNMGVTLNLTLLGVSVVCFVGAVIVGDKSGRVHLPKTTLQRVAMSGDVRAAEALFVIFALAPAKDKADCEAALAAYFRALPTLEIYAGSHSIQHSLDNILGSQREWHPDLAVAAIEACVRLNFTAILPRLLWIGECAAPTQPMRHVRDAAQEAIPALTAHADFGALNDIPAQIDELYRQMLLNQNPSLIFSERQLWLRHALTNLLPQLSKHNAAILDKKHRDRLHWFVRQFYGYSVGASGRSDAEFKQAILLCLGNIEDIEAIPAIKAVAHMEAPTDYEQETRALARKQLARLEEIRDRLAVGGTLLRASEAPATGQDQLLRPAAPTQEEHAELLLRPHNGQ